MNKDIKHTRELVKQSLDDQVATLSDDVTDSLDAMRRQAILNAEQSTANKKAGLIRETIGASSQSRWFYIPAVAASLLVAIVMVTSNINPTHSVLDAELITESGIELVLVNEDFELLQEEIEFYLWLEENAPS